MRAFWEQVGVLGPVYRLVGRGLSDADIAKELGLAEVKVRDCIAWTLHFLRFTNRDELVRHSSNSSVHIGIPIVVDTRHGWSDQQTLKVT